MNFSSQGKGSNGSKRFL